MSVTPSPYEIFLKKFGSFTEIQEKAIGLIGSGRNCLLTAPTGSGKTEAALLPILNKIYKKEKRHGIQAVYITPLRALNRDLIKRLEGICMEVGITVNVRHGDTTTLERKKQSENPPDLLITTPESLQTIFLSGKLREALKSVETVLVDEIHELYHNKRGAQLSIGLERLVLLSGEFQRVGISATVGETNVVAHFLFGNKPFEVVKALNVKEFDIRVEMPMTPEKEHKGLKETFGLDKQSIARIERVAHLIKESEATIVFTNTRQAAESLGSKLLFLNKSDPFGNVSVHHSSLDKEERIKVENDFKDGKIKGIIATSSLELGIDVGRVDLVIQYGSPKQSIRLVQRVGRAGHREKLVANGKIIVGEVIDAVEATVIVNNVVHGKLESHAVEKNAYDVVVNQICAMAMEYKKVEADKVYKTIVAAAPFSDLKRSVFDKLLEFASELKIVKSSGGFVSIGARGMQYFFSNISVIPDNIRFSVKNIVSNRVISSLDEKFVYNYLDTGASFITKGLPWRVVSIEESVIFVEPSSDVEASVPDWEGEDIPVSKDVAEAVFKSIDSDTAALGKFADKESMAQVNAFVEKQRKFFVPSVEKIFVEELESYAVIYIGLGKLANEFLAKVIGSVALREYPGSAIRATPYAIVLEFGESARRPDLRRILEVLGESANSDRIRNVIATSDIFRYKFVQIAKLFGVVDKKAALTKSAATRLIDFYKGSLIFDETLRDLSKNNLDADTANAFLKALASGKIKIEYVRSPGSPLSQDILRAAYHYREMLMPNLPSERDVAVFKTSMQGKELRLLCTFCGFVSNETIETDKDVKYLCHSCRSPMLTIYREEYEEPVMKRISGKRLGTREMKEYESALNEAGLISAYGNRAAIALSTYGVGISTASRLLKYVRNDFGRFYGDLIDAQKTFVRTKRFWKGR